MDAPRLPDPVLEVVEHLTRSGLAVWAVGGALRDALLERAPRDFDLVVQPDLAAAAAALPEAHSIGRHHTVLLLPARTDRPQIEISALGRDPGALEADLARRDFTLNALALDPRSGELFDPFGAIHDLEARVLRAVDPGQAFAADPVRILRGIRLCADLELSIDPATRRGMALASFRLHPAAPERLRDELFRLLRLPHAANALRELHRLGALPALLADLLRGVAIPAPDVHDVYAHSLRRCERLPPDPVLRLAGLLADAAVADARRYLPGRDAFELQRPALLGALRSRATALRLRLSKREASRLERLIRHHPLCESRLRDAAAVRRMLRRVGRDILDDLIALRRSETGADRPDELEERVLEVARSDAARGASLAIGGKEIMQTLSIPEGAEVGRWLARIQRRVLERPDENQRERLIAWLRVAAAQPRSSSGSR